MLKMKLKKSLKNSPSIKIFDGKSKAEKILFDLEKKIKKSKIKPALAVISVGSDPASRLFIKNKKKAARKTGIRIFHYNFKVNAREKDILDKIKMLNNDPRVDGIIVQLPLPMKFKTGKIIGSIDAKKDIDGFNKKTLFYPPLISAIFIALDDAVKNIKKKNIIALVNSDFFGKTLKFFLGEKGIRITCLKNEKQFKIKSADILITVLGRPGIIKGEMLKDKVVLIDAGIVVKGKNRVIGDIDRETVKNKASFLTPVPGGIGPLTVALLLKNAYLASKKYYGQQ